MLLLSLEFSHCLVLEDKSGVADAPFLVRAYIIQIGLVFHRTIDASLSYFLSPFWNSSCRLKDTIEFKALVNG